MIGLLLAKFAPYKTAIVLGVMVALLAVIGMMYWRISDLHDDLSKAQAGLATCVSTNERLAASVVKQNEQVDAWLRAERDTSKAIAEALARVNASAARLVKSAKELIERPLPANPSDDCRVLEMELREFMRGQKL